MPLVRERPRQEKDASRTSSVDKRQPHCGSTVDPHTLDEIIRRVVEVAQPERVILFGCAARGEMTRHSDVDLLIVRDGVDALELMVQIYRRLRGVGAPVDAMVVSSDDLERYRGSHALIFKAALHEGRTVYEAPGHGPTMRHASG